MEDHQAYYSIKNWAEDDKPREKLVVKGRTTLSNAELIAILLGSGSRNESALSLAQKILASVDNNLNKLGGLSIAQLKKFKGIGTAKAVTIAAALEIGRRRRETEVTKVSKIKSANQVFEIMVPYLGDLGHEEFWVLYLDTANKVLHKQQMSKGGINSTIVDSRLILKTALEQNAVGMILVHNHPTGNLSPSKSDEQLTQKIIAAGEALSIKVLDHIIIAQNGYFSFADQGIL